MRHRPVSPPPIAGADAVKLLLRHADALVHRFNHHMGPLAVDVNSRRLTAMGIAIGVAYDLVESHVKFSCFAGFTSSFGSATARSSPH